MIKKVVAVICATIFSGTLVGVTYRYTHAPVPTDLPADDILSDCAPMDMVPYTFLLEQYVRAHISELSPEPAVLGGTFYVTEVTFPEDGKAVVAYEDGHIALVADVRYGYDENVADIVVYEFVVRPEAPRSK